MAWRLGDIDVLDSFRRRSGRVNLSRWQGPSQGYEYSTQPDGSYVGTPILFTCVSRIARRLRTFPVMVCYEDGMAVPKAAQPMWIQDPNPLMSCEDLITSVAISLLLEGEAFVFPLRSGGRVIAVGVTDPRRVTHTTAPNGLEWWVNGLRTNLDFLHIRDIALPGRVRGIRRVEPYGRLSDISTGSLKYTQQHLARGGAYQLVIRSDKGRGTQSKEAREALKQAITDYHSGWRNAYQTLVLPPDIIVEPLNPKMLNADGGFLDLTRATDAAIAVGFGFDPIDLGIGVEGMSRTYSNEPSRVHRIYRDAVEPIQTIIEAGLSELLPAGQYFKLDERSWLEGGPHDRAQLMAHMALANERHSKIVPGGLVFSAEELREVAGYTGPPPEPVEQPEPAPMLQPGAQPMLGGSGNEEETE